MRKSFEMMVLCQPGNTPAWGKQIMAIAFKHRMPGIELEWGKNLKRKLDHVLPRGMRGE